jgi:hypothetical protein
LNRTGHRLPGLEALLQYPLIQAIQERRTRRVARGVSILAGELSHQSHNVPHRLEAIEESILICATGLTGIVMHDGPLKKPSGAPEDLGSMFTNVLARAGPSADNCQATAHLELEYYDRFFDPFLWRNQAAHDRLWHNGGERIAPA